MIYEYLFFIKYSKIDPIIDSNLIKQKFMPAILLEIFTCSLLDSTTKNSTKYVSSGPNPYLLDKWQYFDIYVSANNLYLNDILGIFLVQAHF